MLYNTKQGTPLCQFGVSVNPAMCPGARSVRAIGGGMYAPVVTI